MKAQIINKQDENYGKIFEIHQIFDKFIALNIEDRVSDYGKSEINIILTCDKDFFYLGNLLLNIVSSRTESCGYMRHSEIKKLVASINFPTTKKNMEKAISTYMWWK